MSLKKSRAVVDIRRSWTGWQRRLNKIGAYGLRDDCQCEEPAPAHLYRALKRPTRGNIKWTANDD
jgi:hypothetical protein